MRTVSCCFAVFHVTTSPVTPAIYSVKFLVFHFCAPNFSHPVAVTAVEISLYYGMLKHKRG